MKKKIILSLSAGFLIGVFWIAAIRFLTLQSDTIHYHANFAVYINGVREEFKSPLFYEEVQSCTEDSSDDPRARVHMHNQENSIVHVHDNAATWGHFLANLGFSLSDKSLMTDTGTLYSNGQNGNLKFVLNGEPVDSLANRTIDDKDILLIDFGNEDAQKLHEIFDSIPTDAHKYNDILDPAGCSGSEPLTFTTKLKKSFGL